MSTFMSLESSKVAARILAGAKHGSELQQGQLAIPVLVVLHDCVAHNLPQLGLCRLLGSRQLESIRQLLL